MSLNLIERLGTEPVRTKVIDDCVALIDNQVRGKGLVIRTAYGTVKALKKNFVREVDRRAPQRLDGQAAAAPRQGGPPPAPRAASPST